MPCLLDVNVLIALVLPQHVFHQAAHHWFPQARKRGFATSPITQLGFLRLSVNPAISPVPLHVDQALEILSHFTRALEHRFWPDDIPCEEIIKPPSPSIGHKQLTDLYLVALAHRHKGVLATFDRRIATCVPDPSAVELIAS